MGEPESVDQPKNDATLFAQMKERLFSAVISDALDQVGVRDRVMRADLRPLDPSMVICGRAFTILSADVYEKNRDPYEMEIDVKAGTKWALPHFWCNPAADWRNPLESREPLCDRFAWGFSVCGDFFEASGWSFAVRSFRRHTLPSPSRARRSVHRVLRAAVSPAAGTAAIPGS